MQHFHEGVRHRLFPGIELSHFDPRVHIDRVWSLHLLDGLKPPRWPLRCTRPVNIALELLERRRLVWDVCTVGAVLVAYGLHPLAGLLHHEVKIGLCVLNQTQTLAPALRRAFDVLSDVLEKLTHCAVTSRICEGLLHNFGPNLPWVNTEHLVQ